VDKKSYDLVEERVKEYREVTEYFMRVGDRKKAAEFLQLAEKFKKYQAAVMEGKKIDPLKIEGPVTPAVVLGLEESERIQRNFFSNDFQSLMMLSCV